MCDSIMMVKNAKGLSDNLDDLAQAAVAIAQYATDQGATNNRTTLDPNANLLAVSNPLAATAPEWINPAANAIQIGTAGTYSYSGDFISDLNATTLVGVAATINGNNDVILAFTSSALTVTGYNDSIDISNSTATVTASNASILIESAGIGTVTGSNDQIAQVGPTKLTLSSGTGDTVYVSSGAAAFGPDYTLGYATTNASNASITLGSGAGTAAGPDLINGGSDSVMLTDGD
jgi:trimeric autotransporter adhesin